MPQAVEDLEERKALRKLLDEERYLWDDQLENLYGWVHRATKAYLASGCDPQALAREAPGFVAVVRAFFARDREAERQFVDEAPGKTPPESEDVIAEARQDVAALDRLLARLDDRAAR